MTIQSQFPSSYDVGYKKTPVETRFQPGQSGNPSGARKRKAPASLEEAITAKLNEPLCNPGGHRGTLTRRKLMVRHLIEKSAKGDNRALVDLIQMRKEAGPAKLPKPKKISFQEALKQKGWSKLNDTFYAQQDRDKAAYLKKTKGLNLPLADLIDRELARRIKATRAGKTVRASMLDVIATRFANEATTDGAVAKLLQKLIPEKTGVRRAAFVEIAKPNAEERVWLAEKEEIFIQGQRESLKEEYQEGKRTPVRPKPAGVPGSRPGSR